MKQTKILCVLLAGLMLASLSSCSKGDSDVDSAATTAVTTTTAPAPTEPAAEPTEAPTAPASPVVDTQHVFDLTGSLPTPDSDQINALAASISKTYNLHIGVVVANDLGGAAPADFAAAQYNEKYGENTGGMLLLINNGSGEDYIYTSGSCALYLTEDVRRQLLAEMSPLLVTGKTLDAVNLVFAKIQALCPTHFFDEVSCIPPLDANDLNGQAKLVTDAHPDTQLAVLLSKAASQELADQRCKELYDENAAALLVIHPETGAFFLSVNGALSDTLGGTASGALLDKVSAAYANSGVYGAAKRFYLEIGTILG